MTEAAIARMAGASRASANRWARGTHRPDHDPIQRLAVRVHARFPDIARELVEASGYAWAEPQDVPEPVPELDDDPETLEAFRSAYRENPEEVRRTARRMLRAEASGDTPEAKTG